MNTKVATPAHMLIGLTDKELVSLAEELAPSPRPIGHYPGWRWCIEETTTRDEMLLFRLDLWTEFKRRQIDVPITLEFSAGARLALELGNDLSRCLFVNGSRDPNELALLSSYLKPGMIAVDAGANEGFYTTFIASKVRAAGHVFAFEPSAREFRKLQRNIALNAFSQVTTLPIGLGDCERTAMLHVAEPEHSGHNTIGEFCYAIQEADQEPVLLRPPLDAVLFERRCERLDLHQDRR